MEPKLMAAHGPARSAGADAQAAVTALYRVHAVGLIRLAVVMLGDRAAAEDVVQDAFAGLYRCWNHVSGKDRALGYVRSSVLNGCRTRLRARVRDERLAAASPPTLAAASAEQAVLVGEEHAAVLPRVRSRQRPAAESCALSGSETTR
jgi:DNA-directed RNA polymerase specialized sigma24 family protein